MLRRTRSRRKRDPEIRLTGNKWPVNTARHATDAASAPGIALEIDACPQEQSRFAHLFAGDPTMDDVLGTGLDIAVLAGRQHDTRRHCGAIGIRLTLQ